MEYKKISAHDLERISGEDQRVEEDYNGYEIYRTSTQNLFVAIKTKDGSELPIELHGLYTSWAVAKARIDWLTEWRANTSK